jgi:hypothetical protein
MSFVSDSLGLSDFFLVLRMPLRMRVLSLKNQVARNRPKPTRKIPPFPVAIGVQPHRLLFLSLCLLSTVCIRKNIGRIRPLLRSPQPPFPKPPGPPPHPHRMSMFYSSLTCSSPRAPTCAPPPSAPPSSESQPGKEFFIPTHVPPKGGRDGVSIQK